uniref:Transcriptional silencer Sir1 n=1 Tax=Saccharomyces mikatae TaxID=114525 RepID=F7VJP3_SACMI|nr:TPA_inf: transcriptional silencer Sir1 [Saccharomyces mikatae]
MLEINARFVVIDGWLIDVVKRRPVNFWSPDIRLLLPNDDDYEKLLQQDLVNWEQLKKDSKSVLIGVKSMELFKNIKLVLREFFLLEDGRIVLKRIKSKLHYKVIKKFACRCCRLYLPKWGTMYIYPMSSDKKSRLKGVCQFSLNVEPDREYPLIDINVSHQYIIIEEFLLYLNERRLYKWSDNYLRDQIGLRKWSRLRRLYNPVSLDILDGLKSNYYFVKDDLLFQLLGKRVFVKFCKIMRNEREGKIPFWYCARTTTAKASHIAYVLPDTATSNSPTDKKSVVRFIVREQPVVEDIVSNPTYSDLAEQLFIEVEAVKKKISANLLRLENQLMECTDQEKNVVKVSKISSEVLDQIPDFPVSKVTLLLIAAGEDKKYIELVEELARRLEKICIEKTTQSLENIRNTFLSNPGIRARFDKEYYKSTEEYKVTLQLIKEDFLLLLVKQLKNTQVSETEFTREEYISPRFLVADGFLIDLAEEKLVDPKDPRLRTLLKDHQRDIIAQMNLIAWDDLKEYRHPIPLQAKSLFKLCKHTKKNFIRDANFKLHLLPTEENLTSAQMSVFYPCIPIYLDDNTVQYLYDDSVIPEYETNSLNAAMKSKCSWRDSLEKDPESLFQEAIRRMRFLISYEELKINYMAAFEELRRGNHND